MRAFVTGAGGFIGSHLVEELLRQNWEVRALAHYNSRSDRAHLAKLEHKQLTVHAGDVTDAFQMASLADGCDVVFHLAALIGIPYSYHAPASYIATNVSGTLNILEAVRRAKVKRLIVTSTSEVYGTAQYTPIDEAHPLQGQSPYSASKIAADKLAESYFRSFDLPVVTLRPFNTYGPRQSARAVIPTVLTQALTGAKKIELGNLAPRRDLTFVTDSARAFVLAAQKPGIEGETIHFGQGAANTVEEIARLCLRAAGSDAELVTCSNRQRPDKSEVGELLCDPTKAGKLLGWSPKVSLPDGLARTVEYIRQNLDQYRVGEYIV